jgi:hypothetical protein
VYTRVVRFTDVNRDRLESLLASIDQDAPPPGVPAIGLQMLFDEQQGTAIVLQQFESAEEMRAAEEALSAMDPADTPGTRASVDRCELKLELQAGAKESVR